ncbi:MAG: DUF4271 domain-containing protein [Bacteroidales bacterium]|nr:DUF4271 domain-containing protein [Bacteroidales bacterium]
MALNKVDSIVHTADGLPIPPALPDSLAKTILYPEPTYGMVIENPMVTYSEGNQYVEQGVGLSWVFLVIGILFFAVGMKFRNDVKYLKATFSNLFEVKMRQNVFDDTVKEISFIILLNLLWICSAGILLWQTVRIWGGLPEECFAAPWSEAAGIGISTAATGVYVGCLFIGYWVIGRVFTDKTRTTLWTKGASAAMAVESLPMVPLALLTLCYPPWTMTILPIAAGVFIAGKIIFIYKGFRIFFNQMASWMLFLYYLCSLEIVPLILTYLITVQVCMRIL